jgi:hypothetical protein
MIPVPCSLIQSARAAETTLDSIAHLQTVIPNTPWKSPGASRPFSAPRMTASLPAVFLALASRQCAPDPMISGRGTDNLKPLQTAAFTVFPARRLLSREYRHSTHRANCICSYLSQYTIFDTDFGSYQGTSDGMRLGAALRRAQDRPRVSVLLGSRFNLGFWCPQHPRRRGAGVDCPRGSANLDKQSARGLWLLQDQRHAVNDFAELIADQAKPLDVVLGQL